MRVSESIARLYDDHAQALFGFLLAFTRDETDTRDLLQEIFLKAAKDPDLLNGVAEPRRYLLRMARNLAVDFIRRRSARKRWNDQAASETIGLFAHAPDPDERAFRDALSGAMTELPDEQRAVVHLKVWQGFTFEEIAALLELPVNTAASRYRYGLDKLRQQLRPLYEEIK